MGGRALVRMLRKLRTDQRSDRDDIGASLGGLPAGESTPFCQSLLHVYIYADCGTGTPGASPVEPPGRLIYMVATLDKYRRFVPSWP